MKFQELTLTMNKYHWNILGPCEIRWKNLSEMSTDVRQKVYFIGEEDRDIYGMSWHVDRTPTRCLG